MSELSQINNDSRGFYEIERQIFANKEFFINHWKKDLKFDQIKADYPELPDHKFTTELKIVNRFPEKQAFCLDCGHRLKLHIRKNGHHVMDQYGPIFYVENEYMCLNEYCARYHQVVYAKAPLARKGYAYSYRVMVVVLQLCLENDLAFQKCARIFEGAYGVKINKRTVALWYQQFLFFFRSSMIERQKAF